MATGSLLQCRQELSENPKAIMTVCKRCKTGSVEKRIGPTAQVVSKPRSKKKRSERLTKALMRSAFLAVCTSSMRSSRTDACNALCLRLPQTTHLARIDETCKDLGETTLYSSRACEATLYSLSPCWQ